MWGTGVYLSEPAHCNTSYFLEMIMMYAKSETLLQNTLLELHVSTGIPINLLTFEKSFLI